MVGLAIAAALKGKVSSLFVIERHEHFGMETSSRNSEVIHSGIYYRPGSLKARLCREGRELLYGYCREKEIPHKRCGKLIVATTSGEKEVLEGILETARANEVLDGELIGKDRISELEPHIQAEYAAFFPSSGIVDVHLLMQALEHEAVRGGAEMVYRTEVTAIQPIGGGYGVTLREGDGTTFEFTTRHLVNAAGLHAEEVARMAGIGDPTYRTYFWKGEYFALLNGKHKMIERLIYPVPELHTVGLGIHTTPDMQGRQKLGPNTIWLPDKQIDYRVDPTHAKEFFEKTHRFLPFLEPDDLAPDQAGIRPKLQRPGEPSRDFIIREESDRGLPGLVNLIGIESPGLTAALGIGRLVRKMLMKDA